MKHAYSIIAWFEAFTWTGLLIGMYLKYGGPGIETGVWLFGRLHGGAFLLYIGVAVLAALHFRWPWWAWLLAIFAAVPPLVTLPVEYLLRRRGLLAPQGA